MSPNNYVVSLDMSGDLKGSLSLLPGQRDHVEIVTGHTILSLSRGGQGFQRAAEIRTHRYHLANNLIRQLMRRFVSVKSVKVEKLLPLTRGLGIFHKTEDPC